MTDRIFVILTPREIRLLANSIETAAVEHDKQKGSCPADLFDARERAAELRRLLLRGVA